MCFFINSLKLSQCQGHGAITSKLNNGEWGTRTTSVNGCENETRENL